jgi:hypothetical protein
MRRSALEHNIALDAGLRPRKGVALAPHGKTTMSPELFAQQLAAGAWGLTFATILPVGGGRGGRRAARHHRQPGRVPMPIWTDSRALLAAPPGPARLVPGRFAGATRT